MAKLNIIVVNAIHDTNDMLPNISRAAAQVYGVKRMDFNAIKDAALDIKLIPSTVEDLMKIYSSLNYLGYKNNVEVRCLTKEDGYIPLDKFIRKYLRVKNIKSINLMVPYNHYINWIEWRYLRYSLNQMKSILNPVYKDATWNWVREYDTYDGTYVGPCSEEEYGAQLVETPFTVQYVLEDVTVNLVAAPKDQKFLLKYMKGKNFKFSTSVNGVPVERDTEETVLLTEEQDRVLQAIKSTFGDFDLECAKQLLIDLLVNENLYSLDRWRFDENKFETDIMVIIHYVCKEDSDKELFYQNLLYEVMTKMDRHSYFIEPDETLYENEDEEIIVIDNEQSYVFEKEAEEKFSAPHCNYMAISIKENILAILKDIKNENYPSKEMISMSRKEIQTLNFSLEGTDEQIAMIGNLIDDINDILDYLSESDLDTITIRTIQFYMTKLIRYYVLPNGFIAYRKKEEDYDYVK